MLKKLKPYSIVAIVITTIITTLSCSEGKMEKKKITYNSLKEVPDAAWKALAEKKIYFGHQSVGFNIIEGIEDLIKDNPKIKLNIVKTKYSNDFTTGVFAHSTIGTNTKPDSKINEFMNIIEADLGKNADIAAMKICYIDMRGDTDVNKLFNLYKVNMDEIKEKFPDLTIIHFTSPLVIRQTGVKAWVKKLIGKPASGVDDNIRRNEYNDLLRKTYQGKSPVFDIATIESTHLDGSRSTFDKNGMTYYAMAPEYTYDDGHLNETGRRVVAEKFLIMLAGL